MKDYGPGLKPGQRHGGSFKEGYDERRLPSFQPRFTVEGRTIASIARQHTDEALGLLVRVLRGEYTEAKVSDQVRASELVLAYGWGRPVNTVQMEVTAGNRAVNRLSNAELEAVVAGQLTRLPIEGEATEISAGPMPGETDI